MTATFKQGDTVKVMGAKWPGLWTVVKVNPTTYRLESQNGLGLLKASHTYVVSASSADTQASAHLKLFSPGTVVRSASPKMPGLWVVVKSASPTDKTSVVPLGGGGSRWNIHAVALTEVPLEALGDALWTEKAQEGLKLPLFKAGA